MGSFCHYNLDFVSSRKTVSSVRLRHTSRDRLYRVLFVFPLLALAGIRAGAADVSSNSADATANTVVEGAQVSTLDSAQAEQERLRTQLENAPAGYHDRYMNAGDLTASAVETEPAQVSDGYSGYLLETRAGYDSVSSDGYGNQSAAE